MLSPHLLHPMECSWASLTEYMSGLRPSLYKLVFFVMLAMENLEDKTSYTVSTIIN